MSMRSILVPWWGGSTSTVQLDAALHVARRVEAHLDVMFIQPSMNDLATTLGNAVSPPTILLRDLEPAFHDARIAAQSEFQAWRTTNGVPSHIVNSQIRVPFASWSEPTGLPEQLILRRGRLVDMIVLPFPHFVETLDRPHGAALFETGHPVLFVPAHVGAQPLSHVVVAWNGSLHSTRAVIGAMALLRAAERVTLLTTTDRTGQRGNQDASGDMDLAASLSWHGVTCDHHQIEWTTLSPGEGLLQAVSELRATLLVMGAATRSRVSTALSRTSDYVFRNPPGIPVLMAS